MTTLKLKVNSPDLAAAIVIVLCEMDRAISKHPQWPTDNVKRAAIVVEEAGELIREANRIDEGVGSLDELKNECIQTAAMCIRMLNALAEDRAELVANSWKGDDTHG